MSALEALSTSEADDVINLQLTLLLRYVSYAGEGLRYVSCAGVGLRYVSCAGVGPRYVSCAGVELR